VRSMPLCCLLLSTVYWGWWWTFWTFMSLRQPVTFFWK
jgi:hypothetical protein